MRPDEATFRRHLAAGPFRAGVKRGDWSVRDDSWPNPLISVAAAPRPGAPAALTLRFDLTGYPQTPPTAAPWDESADRLLAFELFPCGEIANLLFNPGWNGGTALYFAYDRVALNGHESTWRAQNPAHIWTPNHTIVDYLRYVRDVLHSPGYAGVRRVAA